MPAHHCTVIPCGGVALTVDVDGLRCLAPLTLGHCLQQRHICPMPTNHALPAVSSSTSRVSPSLASLFSEAQTYTF